MCQDRSFVLLPFDINDIASGIYLGELSNIERELFRMHNFQPSLATISQIIGSLCRLGTYIPQIDLKVNC
jgi:hypothetical protein